MTTPSYRRGATRRTDRRKQVLLERQQAAIRRRRVGVTLRAPQKLPLAIGDRIVGTLRNRTASL